MNEGRIPKPTHPQPEPPLSEPEHADAEGTLDLNLDEFAEGQDLQALADEVAQSTLDPDAPAGPAREALAADLAQARKRVGELEKQIADAKDKHHRLLADFANHRNRVGQETRLAVTLAEKKLLLELLPVVDSFDRCLASKYSSVEDFRNGVELIRKQFMEALRKIGVEPLPVKVGDPFDAMHAEALTTITQPGLPDGAVATVFEPGYRLRDDLLRPARVVVNHAPAQEPMTE